MAPRGFDIPEEVWRRIALRGAEGAAWVESLDPLVTELEKSWTLSIGRVLPGGSGSLVLEAETAAGRGVVLKIPLPWLDPARAGPRTLREAGGRGYAELIDYHEASGAMLLERLGKRLSTLGWSIDAQIGAICQTLMQAWMRPSDPTTFTPGDRKARDLAAFVESVWRTQGRPCSERVIETALACAASRAQAFDPERAVLVHGDAHAGNLLAADAAQSVFKFVDPEGLFVEPAYDLSAPMRDWGAELLGGDALLLGRDRRDRLARLTGLDPESIWQWGFLERVSTGLHLLELGWEEEAHEYLSVAEAWAAG